jgi:hypothetical protein
MQNAEFRRQKSGDWRQETGAGVRGRGGSQNWLLAIGSWPLANSQELTADSPSSGCRQSAVSYQRADAGCPLPAYSLLPRTLEWPNAKLGRPPVTPAKAGVHRPRQEAWIPAFAGMTVSGRRSNWPHDRSWHAQRTAAPSFTNSEERTTNHEPAPADSPSLRQILRPRLSMTVARLPKT